MIVPTGCGVQTVVALASTMRAGSTLLKALLAEAEDVSNLPETNFQNAREVRATLSTADVQRIVVLKRPAWYHEVQRYPRLPEVPHLKCICLVRDVYDTVVSLRKMSLGRLSDVAAPFVNHALAHHYWSAVNNRLASLATVEKGEQAMLVRYEDLVANPLDVTRELFKFVGSERQSGVDRYSPPESFEWKWGSDDGGEQIKTLSVQQPRARPRDDQGLLATIGRSARVQKVREALGYPPMDED